MEIQTTPRDGAGLAKGLGWFSLGLGVAELAAPKTLARLVGARPDGVTRNTLRAFGAREIMAGLSIFQRPHRAGPLWARVAGDALDLAALGWLFSGRRTKRERTLGAIAAVLGVAVLDVIATRRLQRNAAREPAKAITINRSPADVYAFWQSLEGYDVEEVTFCTAPDGFGTEVRVSGAMSMQDLRKLKQMIETGEITKSDASIHRGPHPARPPKGDVP